ncbi:MAG: Crp/Fnr family transcriptional regulator [Anaerolineae bacterium]|nr:Crp/Fnr family transcriptional regulator [Anaerolineae bacterium]
MAGVQFLHNVSLFANLSITELEPLAQRFITRKYRNGERVFDQGSPGNSLYIVKAGLVNIDVLTKTGERQVIAQYGSGQAFGEFGLLDGLPRSAGAVACERSELMILTRPEFFMYLEKSPDVAINLVVLLSRRLRFALQRAEDDIIDPSPPVVRLARLLVNLVDRYGNQQDNDLRLALRLTQGELAGMMGCPRSEADAALTVLRDKGLVETHGLQMMIHNLAGLRAVADQ